MNPFLFLSLTPFIIFIYLLLYKKTSLLLASITTSALMLFLALEAWQIQPTALSNAFSKGSAVALDILLIIFGAIFFLEILKKVGIISNLCNFLEGFSKDHRVQVVFLAWFLENFIEGTAGFGTPAAVVAPILVGLGLTPIAAVTVSLLGNSTSVVFGAAGTPIRVGFAGLNTSSVPLYTALINCTGLLVPAFMVYFISRGRKEGRKEFFEALPFALWSGAAFCLPSIAFVYLGQEFPSILGSVVGLALVMLTTKLKILTPKTIIDPHPAQEPEVVLSKVKVFFPYALLIFLLIAGKFIFGSFNPGLAFLLASLPVMLMFPKISLLSDTFQLSLKRAFEPFLIILAMAIMVQLLTATGGHFLLASLLKTRFLPFLAPFAGAFGSFITGSATISNLMFGKILETAAIGLSKSPAIVLSLGLVGSAAGNMIALADMLAGEAIVGLKNKEIEVLKGVLIPCLIYVTLAGIVGLLIA